MSTQGERRLAAIMFTDVVDFTSLSQTNEDFALQLLEEHRGVVRPVVARHRGTEVKTIGDAFLVEFGSALEAVRCAVEIQTKMHERNLGLPPERVLLLRIGIHVGDVVHSQGDILGDAVNVSSRIEPLAEPGGVCVSGQAYDYVRNKLGGVPIERLQPVRLKNIKEPMEVYKVVMPWETTGLREEVEMDRRRVAVLPLKNMSPDPNDEYFADGMTEELITALSKVSGLTVIARTSVMQYKTAPKRISEIGRELNVGTLIEGSVRKASNKVRITVQMVDSRNEGHLWVQSYDKQLDDVFTVQSEVAEKVAEELKVKLEGSDKRRMEKSATTDPEAYNLYLQGLFYWNKRTPDGLNKAAQLFRKATQKDPGYALGYAGMALSYFIIAANLYDDPARYYPMAKELVLKALSLDDDLAEAHAVLATIIEGYEFDLEGAEAEFKRAIELNPSYPSAHQWYAQHLWALNRKEEAWKEVNKALELSPLSLIINANVADGCYWRKDYEKGMEQARKVIEMDPSFPTGYQSLIFNAVGASRFDEAREALKAFGGLATPADAAELEAYVYAYEGRVQEARKLLRELRDSKLKGQVSPSLLGSIYFKIGDADSGFEMFERAYSAKDRYLLFIGVAYELDGYRSDPRYLSLLERIGLAGQLKS
ncbi:MAG TPA: adenylate/guanylate cyclase domain-containing protein [Nitrososphaerales archaeon]|nr:adenylate/guanylate cyclase domain-containing protein [Nitrososphaerales archaeon]